MTVVLVVFNGNQRYLKLYGAFECHGKSSQAYVLSQPSVVTLNNIRAVLDKNITFYTKLQGEKVAKLESITTGSLLRVTPRLLNDNGTQK